MIATGESYSLEQFVAIAFEAVGLDWKRYVDSDPALFRPTDLPVSRGNPSKAARVLGWRAKFRTPDVVRAMIAAETA